MDTAEFLRRAAPQDGHPVSDRDREQRLHALPEPRLLLKSVLLEAAEVAVGDHA
jgi:hypothetical protein